jgi:hypothetical protein
VNELYFRCETCKRFVEAGYRWAYATLVEPGVVHADDYVTGGTSLPAVSAEAVLGAAPYWQVAAQDALLAQQLDRVRTFLLHHGKHTLSFGDIHRLHRPAHEWLSWLSEDGETAPLPRYFAEVLKLKSWADVESHVRTLRVPPWWWSGDNRIAARRKFEESVQGVTQS